MNWGLRRNEANNLQERTEWYAFIRLLLLLAVSIPGLLSLFIFEGWSQSVRTDVAVVLVALSSNLLLYGLARLSANHFYHRLLAGVWISFDIALITIFMFLNGAIESRSPILYAVPMLIAAALFGRKAVYLTALMCSCVYIFLILGDYYGVISSTGAINPSLRYNFAYVINSISFFPAIFMVIALATDFITSLLSDKQKQVAETISALETAQEIAKVGSWEWDIKHDEIMWSKVLYQIYGLKPSLEPMNYNNYLSKLRQEDVTAHKKNVSNALKKKIAFTVDHQIEMPDGSIKYLHGEGRPITDKDGNVIKMSGTTQDVTAIYHLDLAKREFVSLASHQLRTPASGVKAFLSLLLEGHAGKIPRSQKHFLNQAYDANERQLEIIDNLLSLASIESGKMTLQKERIDIQGVIKRCIASHTNQVRTRKQKITFKRLRDPLFVYADPGVLEMALDNLVSNASKYTLEHGFIHISLRPIKTAVYIDITDTGIGIARTDIPLLFQKFSRINDPSSKTVNGSGLGLYMAKYIVELHGGKIMVTSRHGQGTTFTVKLPLSQKKS